MGDIDRVRGWRCAGCVANNATDTDKQLANVLALGRFFLFFSSECVVPGNWQIESLAGLWDEVSGYLGALLPGGTCYKGLNHLAQAKRMLFLYKNLQTGALNNLVNNAGGVWTQDAVITAMMESYDVSVRHVLTPEATTNADWQAAHEDRIIPRQHNPPMFTFLGGGNPPPPPPSIAWEDLTHGLGPRGFGILPQVTPGGKNFANFPVRALGERQGRCVAGGVAAPEDDQNREIFNQTYTTFLNLVQKDASWLEALVNGNYVFLII